MSWPLALLAAACGYIAGSIPFARIIARWVDPGRPLETIRMAVPGGGELISDAVSATTIRLQYGARYGCLTSLLDMAKAAGVTAAFFYAFPGQHLHLIAAGMATVGHIWPAFGRFRGGRGQSPIIGSLWVIDPLSPWVVYPAAQLLGLLTRMRPYVGRFGPEAFLIPWFWFRFRSLPHMLFALGLLIVRLAAMRSEIAQFRRLRREGKLRSLSDELAFLGLDRRVTALRARFRRSDPDPPK